MTGCPTLPGAKGILRMPGFQCLNQECPGKTKTQWSHLLALGGRRREGSFLGRIMCYILLWGASWPSQTAPHLLWLGLYPTAQSSASAIEVPCARTNTRAMAKSTHRSFSLPRPQHSQL